MSWKIEPAFVKMGRTGSMPFETPLALDTPRGTVELHTLKVKGIGLCDHHGNIQPPTTREYYRIHREETFSFFVVALRDLLLETTLGRRYPQCPTSEQMIERITGYASPETASYIEELVSEIPDLAVVGQRD